MSCQFVWPKYLGGQTAAWKQTNEEATPKAETKFGKSQRQKDLMSNHIHLLDHRDAHSIRFCTGRFWGDHPGLRGPGKVGGLPQRGERLGLARKVSQDEQNEGAEFFSKLRGCYNMFWTYSSYSEVLGIPIFEGVKTGAHVLVKVPAVQVPSGGGVPFEFKGGGGTGTIWGWKQYLRSCRQVLKQMLKLPKGVTFRCWGNTLNNMIPALPPPPSPA